MCRVGGLALFLKLSDSEDPLDFNPDDAQQYLEGIEYPASKEEISSAAEQNGAPEDLVGLIGTLPRPRYSSQEEFMDELRARPGGG